MSGMTAMCGLPCHECGAFQATRDNDDARRAEIAKEWSQMYNAELTAADINCTGCSPDGGTLFQHCTVCEIRKCGVARGVANCAYCDDYACEKLEEFFKMVPDCQTTLDGIRSSL